MNISEKLSEQQLQNILLTIYEKGQSEKNINVTELIEEIKEHIMTVVNATE
ncbi:hypothetical protein [Alkalihalobacterium alkalinitrilicum]|uniref:hypothetical protein n=1 Tax=Alkalihalobacterium alkalinitrilicum TaxID=427920 RepID=UPI001303333A|nr:hypothetical protein [Alkalihalobacterium alkalinitrilicum]